MSFPRYPDYKTADGGWLHQIPSNWNLMKGRRLFFNSRRSALANDEQLTASQKYGVIPQKMFMGLEDQKVMLAIGGTENFKHVDANDFVISLRSFQGGIEIAKYSGCVSPAYTVLKFAVEGVEPKFFEYLLKSKNYVAELQSLTDGMRDGKSISYNQFGSTNIPFPSYEDQQRIAKFLTYQTDKIDTLIAEQEKLIELLKEKRQAVISHAVTKGLESDVKMKDSGVEWLGEVPEHWTVTKIKSLTSRISSGKTPSGGSEVYVSEGVMFLRSQNVYDEGLLLDDVVYIPAEIDEQMAGSRVIAGDILINITGGSIGRSCSVPIGFPMANVNQHVCAIRLVNPDFLPFVEMFFKSYAIKSQTEFVQNGAAREGLNFEQIGGMNICLPSLKEQLEIIQHVNKTYQSFNDLVDAAQNSIVLLQERRSALIFAAVTGQIDVRNVVLELDAA